MATDINFPFGSADLQEPSAATGATAISVEDTLTIVKLSGMTGAVTLNLTINDKLKTGSILKIIAVQNATGRNVALGTGFDATAPDLTGVANDRDCIECVYNGTAFEATTTWLKVVDAV